jgi:general secretion pathway protein K
VHPPEAGHVTGEQPGLSWERDVTTTPHPALREIRVRVWTEPSRRDACELVEVVRVPGAVTAASRSSPPSWRSASSAGWWSASPNTSAVDQHVTRNALAALQADALARSAAAAATTVLAERDPTDVDWAGAPWSRGSGRQRLGAGWVEAAVEDEARRLPINLAEFADARAPLFALLGLGDELEQAVEDWIDADDVAHPLGAERDYYLALPAPHTPRNAPLATVGELGLVRGFSPDLVARLRPFVTVTAEPAVNPNTAPREVLTALLGDAASADRFIAARARAAIDLDRDLESLLPGVDDDRRAALRALLTARGARYTVHVVAAVGDVQRAWDAIIAAPPGLEPDLEAWRPTPPG